MSLFIGHSGLIGGYSFVNLNLMTKLLEVVEGIVIGITLGGITFALLGIIWLFLPENDRGLLGITVNIMAVGSIIVGPVIGAIYGTIWGISTEFFVKFLKLFLKSTLVILLCLLTVLASEWTYAEIRFQQWLNQNEYRLDFSTYSTPEELKKAIFTKLPIGSSITEVQAFRQSYGYSYKEPDVIPHIPFYRYKAGRGLFGMRAFFYPYVWVIYFKLDPTDYSLVDIEVFLKI